MAKSYSFTDSSGTEYQYALIRQIGQGSFGTVSEATEIVYERPTGRSTAVKECEYCFDNDEKLLEEISSKLQRIRYIKNENVTEYYYTKAERVESFLEPVVKTVVIMEFCHLGTLEAYIRQTDLPSDQIKDITRQILNGLVGIHSHKVIHMDLKTANIVLTHKKASRYGIVAKITDLDDHFALSATITKSYEVTKLHGTPVFMSPEMLSGGGTGYQIGKKTDIWSMGCVIVELYRKEAFRFVNVIKGKRIPVNVLVVSGAMEKAIERFILDGGIPEIPADIPDVARTMIEKCFERDPKQRPSAADLLHSVWFENTDALSMPFASKPDNAGPRHEFILRNAHLVPNPNREMLWDCGVNCGARVLVHHIPHTHFPTTYYTTEAAQAKKNIDPGQPIDDKYKQLGLKCLRMGQAGSQLNPLAQFVNSVGQFLLESSAPRLSALVSLMLPTIGPSFPDVAAWMNKYTSEYEYVCKGRTTWKDIKFLIDMHEPVIAQICLGELPVGELVRQMAVAAGCSAVCPTTFPSIDAFILRGYEGVTANDEPHTVVYTTYYGETEFMAYEKFEKCANWMPTHPLTKEAFDLAGYEHAQIIYRIKKSPHDEPD